MLEIDSVKVVCEADVYTTAEDKNKHDYLTMSQPPKIFSFHSVNYENMLKMFRTQIYSFSIIHC